MWYLTLLISISVVLLNPDVSLAERRVALVVGNSTYEHVRTLDSPAGDANAVAELLKTAGFQVSAAQNLNSVEFRRAVREFTVSARNADAAVVYFSGYGVQVRGRNYVVPVDAALRFDIDVTDEAISLDRLIETVEEAKQLRLVVLDTCRANPFPITRRDPLAREPSDTFDFGKTLVAFAAKPGTQCVDGTAPTSRFTTALLRHLATPGLDVGLALRRVIDDVRQVTDNRQEPVLFGGSALGGAEVPLVPALAKAAAPAATQPAPKPAASTAIPSAPKAPRLALVIGNEGYKFAPPLKNVISDVLLVSDALRAVGFDVRTATNLDSVALDRTLREFLTDVTARGKDAAALIFYAGQGVEIDGDNFFIPVDIKVRRQTDILAEAVPLSSVLNSLALTPSASRMVVFDTSRSNPFSPDAAAGTLAIPPASLVAFSTSPGREASEGAAQNSPFAAAFAETIKEPGLSVEEAFEKIRDKVRKATDGQQVPQENSSLAAPFAFASAAAQSSRPSVSTPGANAENAARTDYELTLGINTAAVWEAFLEVHPAGFYATLARAQLKRLTTAASVTQAGRL